MATVNLGRIKFVWQGAYSGATAYVADDVVSYNGSSYICILASTGNLPTNATYWSLMAQSGTDITSLAGLAQGDVLYYNGTSWVRLGAGTSGQYLQTNGSGANPAWATVATGANAGEVIQVVHTNYTSTASSTSATPADVSGFSATITPSASANNILIFVSVCFGGNDNAYPYVLLKRGGTSIGTGTTGTGNQINTFLTGAITSTGGSTNVLKQHSKSFLDSPSSTSALTYQIQLASPYASIASYINRPHSTPDTVYVQYPTSTITLMEIKG